MRSTLCIALVFVAVACSNATKSGAPAAGKEGEAGIRVHQVEERGGGIGVRRRDR